MSPDAVFWIQLLTKMALAAGFVLTAAAAAERGGPVIGGLVTSLPLSGGPVYVFIALDHDAAFVAESALSSFALNNVTIYYATAYAALARRHGALVSVGLSFACWLAIASLLQAIKLTPFIAIAFTVLSFVIGLPIARRFTKVTMPLALRRWYDVPVRATTVACLVAVIVLGSERLGSQLTGTIAVFPVIFTSVMLILHPRIGGPATAAVLCTSLFGLIGYAIALFTVYLNAVAWGKWTALAVGALISIAWNLGLWLLWKSALGKRLSALISSRAP